MVLNWFQHQIGSNIKFDYRDFEMSNELYEKTRSSRFTLNLPEIMRQELEKKAKMDFLSLNSAIIMRLAKSLREEKIGE